MSKLTVHVVTPGEDLARGEVDQVVAPSIMGEVGVLPDHRPLLATMKEGRLGLHRGNDIEWWAVSGGFVEVHGNNVTVLADTAELGSNIDVDRAKTAIEDANKRLETLSPGSDDYDEEHARIERNRVRLDVAGLAH